MRALEGGKKKLTEYQDLIAKISELEEKKDALKGEILAALMDEPEQKAQHRGFEFTIQRRKTGWKYSEQANKYKKELKAIQDLEKANGTATYEKDQAILVMKEVR